MATILRKTTNVWLQEILKHKCLGIVLNLGCGNDSDKQGSHYSNYFKSDRVIKIDKDKNYPNLDYIAPASKLPLRGCSIDFLFMNWMFYKTEMHKVVEEIKRVLKPGAYAIISYADESSEKIDVIRNLLRKYFIVENSFNMIYHSDGKRMEAEIIYGTII